MTVTDHLALPYIAAAQAQKHVTHNEALRMLDALVMLAVKDRDLGAPPAPEAGDRYIVASGANGDWTGHAGAVAAWQDGTWVFYVPRPGWLCFVLDEAVLLAWNGSMWEAAVGAGSGAGSGVAQNLTLLGIGAEADALNPFTAKLNSALWTARETADGGSGDLRYVMSKEGPAGVLSLLMQSDYEGRAEIGLVGDDDLLFKVSDNGATWHEAIRIDHASGAVSFPNTEFAQSAMPVWGPSLGLTAQQQAQARHNIGLFIPARNLIINPLLDINQRGVSGTVVLGAWQYGHDRFRASASGCTYTFAASNGVTTINIAAGSLQQVIEASAFSGREGEYHLSWVGTAQGRINGGVYGSSGQVSDVLDGSANVVIEWGTGTLALPQMERGAATEFAALPFQQSLALCQRYYCRTEGGLRAAAGATGAAFENYVYWPNTMRTAPSAGGPSGGLTQNIGANYLFGPSAHGVRFYIEAATPGDAYALHRTITADAEIGS